MLEAIYPAAITATAAVVGVYLTQFLGEKYKRFKEGSAIAAGILGELTSYEQGWPHLDAMMTGFVEACTTGTRSQLTLREIERPKDLYFEEVVGRLGLLGADIVEPVVFVYSNVRAFRLALEIISRHHREMSDEEFLQRCLACHACLKRAGSRRQEVLTKLKERSTRGMRLSD